MNVPVQVRVPVALALAIEKKLRQVELIQQREEGRGAEGVREAAKKISFSNMIYVAALCGVDVLLKERPAEIYARLASKGRARGRPRRAA